MTDKKDWANISDDEDESSEESPEPSPSNQPAERAEPEEQQGSQQTENQTVENQEQQRRHHEHRPRRSEDEKKVEIIKEIEAVAGPKVYLNLHGLNPNVRAENVREFYQPITISSVIASQTKEGLFDLEFPSKEEAVKAVEKGTGELGKTTFCLRMSHRNYPKDSARPHDKKDRGNKNYGQKNQGNRGGYDNKNKYHERDDYYYNKNQEGGQRGGYDKRNRDRDQGSWKQGGDRDQGYWKQGGDRDQGSWKQGGQRGEAQYQVRTKDNRPDEERKTEEQRPRQEEQQFAKQSERDQPKRQESDKWEKGLQLPDEPKRHDYKKRDDYQRRDDNQRDYKDKFQMKKYNSDYTEGGNYGHSNRGQEYRNNEDKSDTIEKGRGAKKYNQDEPLEQDKILQMKDRQSSYKSQGSDKGYHKKDYNKGYDKGYGGYGGDNYNKSRYYDDQKNYKPRPYKEKDNDYYQGKGEEALQIEKKSSNRDESYKVYTKKPENAGQGNPAPTGSTPTNKGTPELTKKASFSQGSKNTANPFTILENENGKK